MRGLSNPFSGTTSVAVSHPSAVVAQAITTPLDTAIADLDRGRRSIGRQSLSGRIRLAEACADGVLRMAWDWVEVSSHAKGVASNLAGRADEIVTGPMATMRYLRLLMQTFRDIEQLGQPRLPKLIIDDDERLRASILPCSGLYDSLLLMGFRADAWMEPGVTRENLWESLPHQLDGFGPVPPISLVLGAGNNSCIPAIDSLERIIQRGHLVLLKLNPVNDCLAPIFQRAFAPLVNEGRLRIVSGGPEVGAAAVADERIDEIHLTGSIETHDSIVWGRTLEERARRKLARDPIIRKPLTSELGNVTPWIIVPGPYSDRQLRFQAETIAAALTTNAGFNCITPRVLVTWRRWDERERFLDTLEITLDGIPRRKAYYPGAFDRFRHWVGPASEVGSDGSLPWTLLRDMDRIGLLGFFQSEAFACVCMEVALDAKSEVQFLDRAVDFVNGELWGNLAASITIHPTSRWPGAHETRFQASLNRLKYKSIAINHSPGLMFSTMSTPWGGSPRGTLADPRSGLGWVHNTFLLDRVEKTVLEGPLVVYPKPFWMPFHSQPEFIAWRLLRLYHQPSTWNLANVLAEACQHPW